MNNVLKLDAQIVPSNFEENLDKQKYSPSDYVIATALGKAREVFDRLSAENGRAPSLVVGVDTVIVRDDVVLEKPKSEAMAREMLSSLSGREHTVRTGMVLIYAPAADESAPFVHTLVEITTVSFATLTPEAIAAYVATGEPMDKAGAYGIQGLGGSFCSGITGCYWNAVGFPMHRFCVEVDCNRLQSHVDKIRQNA